MLRVCMVDDDPMLLSGIQRVLRRAAPTFEITFAHSGREALAVLEQQPIDVLMSDLGMPEMEGEALLRQVQERFPHVTRILTTGALDDYRAFDLQLVAHRTIAKPMAPASLIALLNELDEWREKRESCEELPEFGSDREISWTHAAAERLRTQRSVITADAVRQNPWLAMLLLQATYGGFVEAGAPLDVGSAVHALGAVRLEMMHRRLRQLTPDDKAPAGERGPDSRSGEPIPLVTLTQEIARSVAPSSAHHQAGGSECAPLSPPACFMAVAESAAVLRAASYSGTVHHDAERLFALRIALDAERFAVPRAIIGAIEESVMGTDGDVVTPGVTVRWAAALLRQPDCLHSSNAQHTLHGTVALATRDRWRELARLARDRKQRSTG